MSIKEMTAKNDWQKGLTLIEIILVVAISTIVISVLGRFISIGYPISKTSYLQARSTESARYQLKRMAKVMREARESATGGYPLVEVLPQRIVFYADVDVDAPVERVRYELIGTNLVRGVTEPSGEPLTYDLDNEVVVVLSQLVRNGGDPVFTYYNGDYPGDMTTFGMEQITEIKYVAFRLLVDADPEAPPPAVEVVSQVQLRNLKINLGEEG